MEIGNSDTSEFSALIVGVTGMVGLSLAEALKNPAISGKNRAWKVYGIARSTSLPTWFPSSLLDDFIPVDILDQEVTTKKLTPLSSRITHIFWVVRQHVNSEETNIILNSTMLKNVLNVMKSASSSSKFKHITLLTGTKHYMGPIFDTNFGKKVLVLDQDPPFKEDVPRLPYPNFYYALEDLLASCTGGPSATPFESVPAYVPSVTYSVHRSSIIIGASSKSFRSSLLTLCVYATICGFKGIPFKYPGSKYTWEHFCDMSDSGLLAEQQIWAAVTDGAKNQAFNCSNGDVFTWKRLWKELSEIFDVGFVEFDEKDKIENWGEMMSGKSEVWDEIVEKYGLYKTKMEDVTCYDALSVVLNFEFQHVCSMNKSRELGFFGFRDTFKSIRFWVKRLKDMKIIP
ncbi:(S)-8-oxocitronellyl enol synthase CYC2-like [Euphorbia lathyris]|uniref:(S)-8-oxocitronellyl enol synthase CYC2-like n=1 Tax=Euphorbia lathyris TaxID=212925 RepID=UPI0033141ED1